MIKLKALLLEMGGTGAGAGSGGEPDYITAGKPMKSKTRPSGLERMELDKNALKELAQQFNRDQTVVWEKMPGRVWKVDDFDVHVKWQDGSKFRYPIDFASQHFRKAA